MRGIIGVCPIWRTMTTSSYRWSNRTVATGTHNLRCSQWCREDPNKSSSTRSPLAYMCDYFSGVCYCLSAGFVLTASGRHHGSGRCCCARWKTFDPDEVWCRRQSDQEFTSRWWATVPVCDRFNRFTAGLSCNGSVSPGSLEIYKA